jgi:hypothetical protein
MNGLPLTTSSRVPCTAWPPHIRVPDQLLHLMGYAVALLDGCAEVILGDVVQLPVTVGNSPA